MCAGETVSKQISPCVSAASFNFFLDFLKLIGEHESAGTVVSVADLQ